MPETLIGYARYSTDEQDLTAQQERLVELDVSPERTYLDHGLTGTNRARSGLDQALAAVTRRATPSSSRNSIGLLAPCPTPGRSATISPPS